MQGLSDGNIASHWILDVTICGNEYFTYNSSLYDYSSVTATNDTDK